MLVLIILLFNLFLLIYYVDTYASPESRKKFFEEYAKVHGFDPLNPENWYLQSFSRINAAEVIFIFMCYLLLSFLYYLQHILMLFYYY